MDSKEYLKSVASKYGYIASVYRAQYTPNGKIYTELSLVPNQSLKNGAYPTGKDSYKPVIKYISKNEGLDRFMIDIAAYGHKSIGDSRRIAELIKEAADMCEEINSISFEDLEFEKEYEESSKVSVRESVRRAFMKKVEVK